MATRPILCILLFICAFNVVHAIPPPRIRPRPSSDPKNLSLPPSPDPLVIWRTTSAYPVTSLAIRFHSYGDPNDLTQVQQLLEYATFKSWTEVAHEAMPADHPLRYSLEDRSMELHFQPIHGMTWGEWRTVLDAMNEFIQRWQSRDYLFENA
ncbi:MAG: hypothetical protein Q9182_007151 [Xanthomendoza sp. 2 TL-2023]